MKARDDGRMVRQYTASDLFTGPKGFKQYATQTEARADESLALAYLTMGHRERQKRLPIPVDNSLGCGLHSGL